MEVATQQVTAAELLKRAEAMQPMLRELQAETEARSRPSAEVHRMLAFGRSQR